MDMWPCGKGKKIVNTAPTKFSPAMKSLYLGGSIKLTKKRWVHKRWVHKKGGSIKIDNKKGGPIKIDKKKVDP